MPLRVIMLTVIGPLLCLAGFFAYLEVTNQNQILTRAHVASVRANEGGLIGDLVHEVQKERGYSAGFIASGGQAFSRELPDQRVQTDAVLDAVTAGLKASDIPREHAVQTVVQQMSALSDMRRQVDALNTSVPQMAKTYTGAITQLMTLARYAGDDGATGRVQQLLQARTLLAGAKERAGLERAMGATGLGNGFTLQLHDSFVSLGGGQEALLLEASMLLGEANWQDDLMATPAAQAVMNARQHIMSGYESGSYDGMTAPDWFRTSTAWINLLRDKELELVAAINAMAAEIETEASGTFFNHLLIAVVSIAGVLVVAFFAFERMIRRIKGLIKVVNGFTNGDFSMTVKGTAGRGELSLMARAVDRFKQDTLRMQEEAEAAKQAETARQEQQDQVVASLRSGLARLSDGDMTVQLNADFPAGYETLREDFNQTTSKLRGTLSEILETAAHIRSGAADISQASDDLSQRTESQAATLEQTAAALDEITASVKAAAENTRSVESTTKEARSEASSSGAVVQDAVKAMAEIETSSNHIAQIVGVIDDIAFQTNLLALNAGVEAARAGEAGRGFAVVASEVRALAQRSSDSAMEIKKLISESSTQVVHGADLVRKAGDALEAIVARVEDISACVSDIAEGASEQSVGLGEINSGVVQLDQVTQQNASMVEQAAGTSTQLNRNANRLTDLVSSFRTEVGNAVPASTVDFPPQQRRYG